MAHWMQMVFVGLIGLAAAPPVWAADTAPPAEEKAETSILPSIDAARAAIDAQDYAGAARMLAGLAVADPSDADIWNLFGLASRKMERMSEATQAYQEALRLKPDHLGALEYQGEMFVDLNRRDEALANLAKLKKLCGDCDEARDLEAYIDANPAQPS